MLSLPIQAAVKMAMSVVTSVSLPPWLSRSFCALVRFLSFSATPWLKYTPALVPFGEQHSNDYWFSKTLWPTIQTPPQPLFPLTCNRPLKHCMKGSSPAWSGWVSSFGSLLRVLLWPHNGCCPDHLRRFHPHPQDVINLTRDTCDTHLSQKDAKFDKFLQKQTDPTHSPVGV
jgi:hypothetical protein